MYPNATGAFNPGDAQFPAQASIGYCGLQCGNFIWYILLFSLFVFIHSTSEVGSMLLILRCVDPRDKAMALGLIQFAIGLFGKEGKVAAAAKAAVKAQPGLHTVGPPESVPDTHSSCSRQRPLPHRVRRRRGLGVPRLGDGVRQAGRLLALRRQHLPHVLSR